MRKLLPWILPAGLLALGGACGEATDSPVVPGANGEGGPPGPPTPIGGGGGGDGGGGGGGGSDAGDAGPIGDAAQGCTPKAGEIGTWRTPNLDGLPPLWDGVATAPDAIYLVTWNTANRAIARYDPQLDRWSSVSFSEAAAPSLRSSPFITWADGRIVIYGGEDASQPHGILRTGAALDVGTGEWTALAASGAPELAPQRDSLTSSPSGSFARGVGRTATFYSHYVDGAYGDAGTIGLTPEHVAASYDFATSTWTTLPSNPSASIYDAYHCAFNDIRDDLAVCSTGDLPRMDLFRPSPLSRVRVDIPGSAAHGETFEVALLDHFVVLWPWTSGNILIYDLTTATWRPHSPNPLGKRIFGFETAFAGRVVFWGGYDANQYFRDGSVYDPSTDVWTPLRCEGGPPGSKFTTAVIGDSLYLFAGKTATSGSGILRLAN